MAKSAERRNPECRKWQNLRRDEILSAGNGKICGETESRVREMAKTPVNTISTAQELAKTPDDGFSMPRKYSFN